MSCFMRRDFGDKDSKSMRWQQLEEAQNKGPKKRISISILWGYPYLIGLPYKGGLYGISLSQFLLMCILGPYRSLQPQVSNIIPVLLGPLICRSHAASFGVFLSVGTAPWDKYCLGFWA